MTATHRGPLPPSGFSPPHTVLDRLFNSIRPYWYVPVGIGMAALIASSAGIIPSGVVTVLAALALFAGAVYMFARYTEGFVFLAVWLALRGGGLAVLVMPPLLVFAGAQLAGRRFGRPWNIRRSLSTAALAVLAFVVGLLAADLSFSGSSDLGGAEPPSRALEQLGIDDGGESTIGRIFGSIAAAFAQVVQWILGEGAGEGVGEAPAEGGVTPPPPPSSPNWILFAIIAALLALALLGWWLWRRRRNAPTPESGRWSIERLEAIGDQVGRKRRPNEGAISYGQALSAFTSDQRLAGAGGLVSGDVYESASIEPDDVSTTLSGIEEDPPPKPPKHRMRRALAAGRRAFGWLRDRPFTTVALVVMAAGLGWLIVSPPSIFGDLNDAQSLPSLLDEEREYVFEPIRDESGRVIGQNFDTIAFDFGPPQSGPATPTPIRNVAVQGWWSDSVSSTSVDWTAGYESITWVGNTSGYPVAIRLQAVGTEPAETWSMSPPLDGTSLMMVWFNETSAQLDDELLGSISPEPTVPGFGSDEALWLFMGQPAAVLGLDGNGDVVSIVIIDNLNRWRGLDLPGEAPVEILEREADLLACVEDPSLLNEFQRCPTREWWD